MIAALCQKVNQRCSLVTWAEAKRRQEEGGVAARGRFETGGQEGGRRQEETEWQGGTSAGVMGMVGMVGSFRETAYTLH